LRGARRSVTQLDLEKFEQFKRKFDPSFVNKNQTGGSQIKWPSSSAQSKPLPEDDDLYG
jgi:transitional endoplasmic reticulum ATPase